MYKVLIIFLLLGQIAYNVANVWSFIAKLMWIAIYKNVLNSISQWKAKFFRNMYHNILIKHHTLW